MKRNRLAWLGLVLAALPRCGCDDERRSGPPNTEDNSPYRVSDLGPGRCVAMNSAGQVLGVDENEIPFVVDLAGGRTSLGMRAPGENTVGLGIDENGVVYGYTEGAVGRVAVKNDGSGWTEIAAVGKGAALQIGAGAIVGYRFDKRPFGFVLRGDTLEVLPLPTDRVSVVHAVSEAGIVGIVETTTQATQAFAVQGGVFKNLGVFPGGKNSTALGINTAGDIVGAAETSSQAHAFVRYAGEAMIDLKLDVGASSSDARGIDDQHRVAMNVVYTSGRSVPYVMLQNRKKLEIMPKDAKRTPYASAHVASAIGDGRIVGWGTPNAPSNMAATTRCIVWTPRTGS